MNEFEKKAIDMLTEDEKEKVAGGKNINKHECLTNDQCGELKQIIGEKYTPKINPGDLVLCKYGGPGMFKHESSDSPVKTLPTNNQFPTD